MKKKILPRTFGVIKSIFNVPAWFDWVRLKSFTTYLKDGIKNFFIPQSSEVIESFDDAQKRLQISDQTLLARQKALFWLSGVMLVIAGLLGVYSFYHLYLGNFRAFILSLIVMAISLVLFFRYNFWSFQIKKRKLGCTFQEWYQENIKGGKK